MNPVGIQVAEIIKNVNAGGDEGKREESDERGKEDGDVGDFVGGEKGDENEEVF
jgi:hypothetical protein